MLADDLHSPFKHCLLQQEIYVFLYIKIIIFLLLILQNSLESKSFSLTDQNKNIKRVGGRTIDKEKTPQYDLHLKTHLEFIYFTKSSIIYLGCLSNKYFTGYLESHLIPSAVSSHMIIVAVLIFKAYLSAREGLRETHAAQSMKSFIDICRNQNIYGASGQCRSVHVENEGTAVLQKQL